MPDIYPSRLSFSKTSFSTGAAFLKKLLSISLEPIREKRKELLKEKTYINEVLKEGAEKARAIAQATMKKVRKKIGLM